MKIATLKLVLWLSSIFISLTPVFSEQSIVEVPDTLDFGVIYDYSKSYSKRLEIKNISNHPLRLNNCRVSENFHRLFHPDFQSPIIIERDETTSIDIFLVPDSKISGTVSSELKLFFGDIENPNIVRVVLVAQMQKDTASTLNSFVLIPHISKKVGEEFDLPIVAQIFPDDSTITGLNATISFNWTMLTPVNSDERGTIENTRQYIRIDTTFEGKKFTDGDTLFFIRMLPMLGNNISANLYINDFEWTGTQRRHRIFVTEGLFTLTDVFMEDSIPRLITSKPDSLLLESYLNPVTTDFSIKTKYRGNARLYVYDLNGEFVYNLSNSLPYHWDYSQQDIFLEKNYFESNRVYVMVLSTRSNATAILLIVQ